MKRKAVEKIPYLCADGFMDRPYRARAYLGNVEGEEYLITEIYQSPEGEIPVVRIATGKKESENYYPESGMWSGQGISAAGPVWERPGQPHGNGTVYMSPEEEETVKKYTGMEKCRYTDWKGCIGSYQGRLYANRRYRMEKRKNEFAKEREAATPPLPERLGDWYRARFTPVLFYKRRGRYADITCGICGTISTVCTKQRDTYAGQFESVVQVPVNGNVGECPACGRPGIYRCRTETETRKLKCYVGQKYMETGALIRYMEVEMTMIKGRCAEYRVNEIARNYFTDGKRIYRDYHLEDWDGNAGWYPRNIGGMGNITQEAAAVYPGTWKELKGTVLRYSGAQEYYLRKGKMKLSGYMEAYKKYPVMEMLSKAGMDGIVEDMACGCSVERLFPVPLASNPCTLMGLDRPKIKRLAAGRGNRQLLYILQMEKRLGQEWKEEQEKAVLEMGLDCLKLERVMGVISIQRFLNQLKKYTGTDILAAGACAAADMGIRETATIYMDYLEMKRTLGYDMKNEIHLRPEDIRQAHRDVVEESRGKEDREQENRMMLKYRKIAERFSVLDRKYHYEDDRYIIRPAKDAAEIMAEGRTLHHCVGHEGQGYMANHDRGSSFILLLRKKEAPEMPYITLEIRGTEVRQWYGAYDKKPDQKENSKWISMYVMRLKASAGGEAGTQAAG